MHPYPPPPPPYWASPPPPVVHYPVPVPVVMPVYIQPRRRRPAPPRRRPIRAVTYQRRQTSHSLHFWLGFWTGGLWWLMWPIIGAVNALGPRRRTVTRYYR